MIKLIIKNARMIGKNGTYHIKLENGKISEISKTPIKGDGIDIKNNYILPGFIDPHVHFRDPGLTQKEDFKSGSESAANGGFTTVIDMPNCIPKTDTYDALKEKYEIAGKKSKINFYFQAGWNTLEEMKKIQTLKPVSFKVFMDLESDEKLKEIFFNLGELKKTTDYNGLVCVHCEKKAIVENETKKLKELDENKAIDYTYARNNKAEVESVKQAIELAKSNNLKLHICHLSSSKSLSIAKSARNKQPLSWEFTPHHLLLNNDAYNIHGTEIKTNPPLRKKNESINIKDIDETSIIGTDHAPHTLKEKHKGVWDSAPGIPNLETVVPLLLTEVNKKKIKFDLIPKILSENASKVFNLTNKGKIEIGADADFTVIDLKRKGKFDIDTFKTKAEYSPFDGMEYTGEAVMTIVNSEIVMNKI